MATQYCEMAESSDAPNAATGLDTSDGSQSRLVGFNKADDEFTLPNCMCHALPRNGFIYQVDVLEYMNKTGHGGDLDDNLFGVYGLKYAMRYVETSRSRYLFAE